MLAALKIDSTILIVVVLPFVPDSAIHFCLGAITCLTFQAKSISLISFTPLLRIFSITLWSGCQPGETIASSIPSEILFTTSCELSRFSSNILEIAPNLTSALWTAIPVTPAPITKQFLPASSSTKFIKKLPTVHRTNLSPLPLPDLQ